MKTITIPLEKFLQYSLGTSEFITVDMDTAKLIHAMSSNDELCHVEFPSADRPEQKYPLVWNVQAWKMSIERWNRRKAYAHKERVNRFLFEKNVKTVSRAIMRFALVPEVHANVLAHKWVTNGDEAKWKSVGVNKLATTESEL